MTGAAGDAPAGAAARPHVPGVGEALPEGEEVLWRGAPRAGLLARHVLHVRLVALYFVATVGWWALRTAPGLPRDQALSMFGLQAALAVVVVGMFYLYATMAARGAEYLVTSRRVVLRVGAVFPVVVNVPLALVTSAGVRRFRDGSGEIVLALDHAVRVSWWLLWPHARTGRLRWPEPLLRGLRDVDAAAAALRAAAAALPPEVVEAAVAAAAAQARPAAGGAPRDAAGTARVAPAAPTAPRAPTREPARPARAGTPLASA